MNVKLKNLSIRSSKRSTREWLVCLRFLELPSEITQGQGPSSPFPYYSYLSLLLVLALLLLSTLVVTSEEDLNRAISIKFVEMSICWATWLFFVRNWMKNLSLSLSKNLSISLVWIDSIQIWIQIFKRSIYVIAWVLWEIIYIDSAFFLCVVVVEKWEMKEILAPYTHIEKAQKSFTIIFFSSGGCCSDPQKKANVSKLSFLILNLKMRIALFQGKSPRVIMIIIETIEAIGNECKRSDASILVTPELFMGGYRTENKASTFTFMSQMLETLNTFIVSRDWVMNWNCNFHKLDRNGLFLVCTENRIFLEKQRMRRSRKETLYRTCFVLMVFEWVYWYVTMWNFLKLFGL